MINRIVKGLLVKKQDTDIFLGVNQIVFEEFNSEIKDITVNAARNF